MTQQGSVSRWLALLQGGDNAAVQPLWQRYFQRLVGLARARLHDAPRRAADEEDVALSAFDSFCRGVGRGRFPQLGDRDNLWNLLVVITSRKAAHLVRDETRQKRGGAGSEQTRADADDPDLEEVLGREPDPQFAAEMTEECRRLLGCLGDEQLRAVALARMEGYSNEEIAAQLGCTARTVERKLQLIRQLWEKEGAS